MYGVHADTQHRKRRKPRKPHWFVSDHWEPFLHKLHVANRVIAQAPAELRSINLLEVHGLLTINGENAEL